MARRTPNVTTTREDTSIPGRLSVCQCPTILCTSAKQRVSHPAPHWEGTAVIDGEFKELKLADYKGKYLVFFFYPLDFTCECCFFLQYLCLSGCLFAYLFVRINTPRKQGGLGQMKIPLLSDLTHQISKDYGVYLEDQGHTLRGLFIIDDKGVLRQITMNDLPVGRSVDETLRLVQAFQYTDKHGEVCPAGWKPGSDTVKPPVQRAQSFVYAANHPFG
uniref:thioredoxin-dependent peroxiredoxin n=1 Tax=Periophthalmus magnuspinnatus TaxID=409849 RepID=A0A3B3ZP94_9GOBI